jgi:uncharacterized membrane protein YfcA
LIIGFWTGFLIIPAFDFVNLPMKQAVGTSLFIIFINSLIGLVVTYWEDRTELRLLLIISAMAILD